MRASSLCNIQIYGAITTGINLYLRSRYYNQIEIFVGDGGSLEIGDNVFINQGARIVATTKVAIGSQVLIGDEVLILDNDYHGIDGENPKAEPIIIQNNVWIASRVIILRGVSIGENSVVAAGSVVTKSIPSNSLAAGVPARVIKDIRGH